MPLNPEPQKKYITVNGVLMKNPAYRDPNAPAGTIPQQRPGPQPLAIISSAEDLLEAGQVKQTTTAQPLKQATSTEASLQILQEPDIIASYKSATPIDPGLIVDKLGQEFAKYETPIGMINKLLGIQEDHLNFIIDDSGSMQEYTDVSLAEVTPYILKGRSRLSNIFISRWEEVADRLHIIADLIAYIPTRSIKISFLNRQDTVYLSREGLSPDQYKDQIHETISNIFKNLPVGRTPTYQALKKAFQTREPTRHYLYTDGVPTDRSPEEVKKLVKERANPQQNSLTFNSCTNEDENTAWMKASDDEAKFVAELDDYNDEREEVLKKQGPAFPYSKGLWVISQLVAATNPDDLDGLDESLPFTKATLENILGYQLSPADYEYYFSNNPNAFLYVREYERFFTEPLSRMIISTQEKETRENRAGYKNGYAPDLRPSVDDIVRQIHHVTIKYSAPQQPQQFGFFAPPPTGYYPPQQTVYQPGMSSSYPQQQVYQPGMYPQQQVYQQGGPQQQAPQYNEPPPPYTPSRH